MQRPPGHPSPLLRRIPQSRGATILMTAVLLLAVTACGSDDPTESPPESVLGSGAGRGVTLQSVESRPVLLVDVVERHTDGFNEPLADVARPLPAEPPFTFDGQRLRLDAGLLDQLDPEALAARNLSLGSPDTPLARCGLLVRRTVRYDGMGRSGGRTRYEAHPGLPAETIVSPGLPAVANRIEIDPAKGSLFTTALTVRLLGGGGSLQVERSGPEGRLTVTYAGRSETVAQGEETVIYEEQREITLLRAALTAGMVEMDPAEGPVPESPDEVLLPAETYGTVAFATRITVRNHGTVPVEVSGRAGS